MSTFLDNLPPGVTPADIDRAANTEPTCESDGCVREAIWQCDRCERIFCGAHFAWQHTKRTKRTLCWPCYEADDVA